MSAHRLPQHGRSFLPAPGSRRVLPPLALLLALLLTLLLAQLLWLSHASEHLQDSDGDAAHLHCPLCLASHDLLGPPTSATALLATPAQHPPVPALPPGWPTRTFLVPQARSPPPARPIGAN